MKALTICQPYAHLITIGAKRVENRNWSTPYRGPLVIHAGKSREWMDPEDEDERYVFGAIVAVADLVDCVWFDALSREQQRDEHTFGPYCWMLDAVTPVKPVPYRGAQGLWDVPSVVVLALMHPVGGVGHLAEPGLRR